MNSDTKDKIIKYGLWGLVALLVVFLIVMTATFFTCSWPFTGALSCKCKNSGGTWVNDIYDGSSSCKCPSGQPAVNGVCSS